MALPALSGSPGGATPPLECLTRTVATLERAGIACRLGGSGLLAAIGLAEDVGDWDLTTDAPLGAVLEATRGLAPELVGPNGLHADHKLRIEGGSVELIVGHAMAVGGRIVRLPSLAFGTWRGVVVASPEVWVAAYHLLGRREKEERLLRWLRAHGARRDAIDRLLAEPLPTDLEGTLRALIPGAASSDARSETKPGGR